MREKILTFIEKNSRIDIKELAIILGEDEISVANELAAMEADHIICGYHTLINWDKTDIEKVTALIEVSVTPQRGQGFDKIAERIYNYPEVNAVYLISGSYDLLVTIEGRTLREAATVRIRQTFTAGVRTEYKDKLHSEEVQRSRNHYGRKRKR